MLPVGYWIAMGFIMTTKTCPKCHGAKRFRTPVPDPVLFEFDPARSGMFYKEEECDMCHGHGILTNVNSVGEMTDTFMSLENNHG